MAGHEGDSGAIRRLELLIGDWEMEARIPGVPPETRARTTFEWLSGEQFVVQRWEVPGGVAPDGIALIGIDPDGDGYLQHYFDSRGVARLYRMSFGAGVWELRREQPDFSPLDFAQRFRGTLSEDGRTIEGRWETSTAGGEFDHDFDLIYTKVG